MAEITETNPLGAGRPLTDDETLEIYLRKLEPFLKGGKTLYRACQEAQIPYRTVKDHYDKGGGFPQKIDAFLAYPANLINNLFFGRLVGIAQKQNRLKELLIDLKAEKIKKEDMEKLQVEYEITQEDWVFIQWYATTSHSTREEYGRRMRSTGKKVPPLVPETSTREVADLLQALLQKDNTTKEKLLEIS